MLKMLGVSLIVASPFFTILCLLLLGFALLSLVKAWLREERYECYRYYRKVKRYLIISSLFGMIWFAEIYFTH